MHKTLFISASALFMGMASCNDNSDLLADMKVATARFRITPMKAASKLANLTPVAADSILIETHQALLMNAVHAGNISPNDELLQTKSREFKKLSKEYRREIELLARLLNPDENWFNRTLGTLVESVVSFRMKTKMRQLRRSINKKLKAKSPKPEGLSTKSFVFAGGMLQHQINDIRAKISQIVEVSKQGGTDLDSLSQERFLQLYLADWTDDDLEFLLTAIESKEQE